MEIINLTPHVVIVKKTSGDVIFQPSGSIARVEMEQEKVGEANGIPIFLNKAKKVTGLPDPTPDTIYIVSVIVAQTVKREQFVAPDTGPTAVRDKEGQVVAVRGFVTYK